MKHCGHDSSTLMLLEQPVIAVLVWKVDQSCVVVTESVQYFCLQILRGSLPIDVITAPVVRVSFTLVVSLDDFFDPQYLVSNLAFVLNIPWNTVRVVDVISEDTVLPSGRRRRASGTTTKMVTMEIGNPAANRTSVSPPTVAEQVAEGNVDASQDDVDFDANSPVSTLTCTCVFHCYLTT